jgi:hypothetical protein
LPFDPKRRRWLTVGAQVDDRRVKTSYGPPDPNDVDVIPRSVILAGCSPHHRRGGFGTCIFRELKDRCSASYSSRPQREHSCWAICDAACGACHSRHFYGGLVHALSSNVRMGSYHDIGCVDNDALPRARYPRKTLRLLPEIYVAKGCEISNRRLSRGEGISRRGFNRAGET